MKNHRILMLIIACAVLDWLMVSSSREQERRMTYREVQQRNRALAAHILAQRVMKHEENQKTHLS